MQNTTSRKTQSLLDFIISSLQLLISVDGLLETSWIWMTLTKRGVSTEIQVVLHSDYLSAKVLHGNVALLQILNETN